MSKRHTLLWVGVGLGAISVVRALARKKWLYAFGGRTVFITGGSRGLGLLLARRFAREGANLALCARDRDELQRAKDELAIYGVTVQTFVADVTQQKELEAALQKAHDSMGAIDVLVNNAGVISVGPMENMTLTDYETEMKTHFWAPLWATMFVAPQMQQRKQGRIVNISSIGGKVPIPHMLPYSASKHALVGFSDGSRSELAKDGVFVTTVCPGLLRTGSHLHAEFKGQNRAEYTLFTLGNSNPLLSADADIAADQIVEACRYGDPELIISLPAKLATWAHTLFPNFAGDVAALAGQALPRPGGIGTEKAEGKDSETALTRSPLTGLSGAAALQNNEIAPQQ